MYNKYASQPSAMIKTMHEKKPNKRMKASHLFLYLSVVALFGFLDSFMIQNYCKEKQARKIDPGIIQLQQAPVNLDLPEDLDEVEHDI